jgi:hypothetical protein
MVEWPDVEELKQFLDVTGNEWDGLEDESEDAFSTRLSRALAAAIAYVKQDVGDWDELVDEPDASLADAAMAAAIKFATLKRQVAAVTSIRQDPVYQAAIRGHRRRFAIA